MNIITYIPNSQYDVLVHFAQGFDSAFRALGHNSIMIDLRDHKSIMLKNLHNAVDSQKIDLIFSISAVLADYAQSDSMVDIPFFGYFVDNPLYYIDRLALVQELPSKMVSFIANEHADICREFFDVPSFFIPHGVKVDMHAQSPSMANREIPILFAGSYRDPDRIRASWGDGISGKVLEATVRAAQENPGIATDVILLNMLDSIEVDVQALGLDKLRDMYVQVDRFLRQTFRRDAIKSIVDQPVHIYGNGWEQLETDQTNLVIHQAADFQQIQSAMLHSKIVLNIENSYKHGSHERVFEAMSAGSVCVSNRNAYTESYRESGFIAGQNVVTYEGIEHINDVVNDLLEHPDQMESIGTCGKELAYHQHSWASRAKQVLEAVSSCGSGR